MEDVEGIGDEDGGAINHLDDGAVSVDGAAGRDAGAIDASHDAQGSNVGDAAGSETSDGQAGTPDARVDGAMDATAGADANDGAADAAVDAAQVTPDSAADANAPDAPPADASTQPFWYRDCDGDGYAASRVGREQGSQKPAATAQCFDWTLLDPTGAANIDCDDMNEYRHPGAGPGLPFVGGQLPAAGTLAYDLDCDGTAEPVVDFVSTGVIRAGKLEVFGFCETAPVCPEAKKCLVFFAFPETPLCGVQYDAQVALDDVRCTQTIPIYFLCE